MRTEQIGTAMRHRNMIDAFFVLDANTIFRTRYGLLENAHVLVALCGEMVTRSNQVSAKN